MKGRWALAAIFLGIICAILAGTFLSRTPDPAIVLELRGLPEVAAVEFTGPHDAKLVVVHIRDLHLVPKELADVDGLDYSTLLKQVELVQADELAIVRSLVRHEGVTAVFSEGVSTTSMAGLTLRLDLLNDVEALANLRKLDSEELGQREELLFTVGAAGRLLVAKEIAEVLPLEDEKAMQDGKPAVQGGQIVTDPAKILLRRKAMINQLPPSGLAVVILGGSHDLGPHLPNDSAYIRVTPRSYP